MINPQAARGFDERAGTYQSARPTYNPALVNRFVGRFGAGRVLDLGAGTGIFTAQLVARGLQPVAVEPVAGMRAQLARRLPHVDVVDGTAEAISSDDESVDTVVAAQAFHWFDHRTALDEIARVLRAGGSLVTVWNVRDEATPMMAAFTRVVDQYAGDTPRWRDMVWREAIDQDDRFELVDDWSIANPWPTTREAVVDRALSTSFIAALEPTRQDLVAHQLRRAIADLDPATDFAYRSELQAWRLVA